MSRQGSDKRAQRLRRYWDKHARTYDKQMAFWERRLFGNGRQWVCAQATGDVLEVAIGTGRNLPYYPEGIRLTGIEFSPAMLELARRHADQLGRKVDLRLGDAQALDLPDASFDTGRVHPVTVRHPQPPAGHRRDATGPAPRRPAAATGPRGRRAPVGARDPVAPRAGHRATGRRTPPTAPAAPAAGPGLPNRAARTIQARHRRATSSTSAKQSRHHSSDRRKVILESTRLSISNDP
jgi:SAM-dependent methyltransferase